MALQRLTLDRGRDVISDVEAVFPDAKPVDVASGICRATFGGGFYDDKLYISRNRDADKIFEHLVESGIYNPLVGAVETDYEWSYGVMAIAGLSTRRPHLTRLLEHLFRLDPGIDGRQIDREFDGAASSFWFSIGGELLQSHLRSFARVRELRLGTLGLLSAMKLKDDSTLKVSDLFDTTASAFFKEPDVSESSLFMNASKSIHPILGQKILNMIGALAPSLISKGIVPSSNRMPSDSSDVISWPREISTHEDYVAMSQSTIALV